MEQKNSVKLDPATIACLAPNSFTTLPVWVNKHDQLAQKVSHEFVKEWQLASNSTHERWNVLSCRSPIGHLVSLCFPESTPEIVSIFTKLSDYGLIDDDIIQPNGSLEEIDIGSGESFPILLSRDPGYRILQYSLFFEISEIYNEFAPSKQEELLKSVWTYWQARTTGVGECKTLEQYIAARYCHTGLGLTDTLGPLSIGISLTDDQIQSVEHIVRPLKIGTLLTVDYFSYAKEKRNREWDCRPIVSAILVIMAEHSISEKEAIDYLKAKIIELEEEHSAAFNLLDDNDIPGNLKKHIMAARYAAAGAHVWAACSPRYHGVTQSNDADDVPTRGKVDQFWNWVTSSLGF